MINNKNQECFQNEFFLIVPIGLEEAAKLELLEWCGILAVGFGSGAFAQNVKVVKGGVTFSVTSPSVAFYLNACLKIPSRILQRLHVFQTREWAQVEKELKIIDWKFFFPQGISKWEIAASESRMNNEKHLAQFLNEKFENRFYKIQSSGSIAYLRVHDNVFTVSRDTSGEHLHFRGYRKKQGEAPLRENLAAFLWFFLLKNHHRLDVERAVIVDPFVGSGTLLCEMFLWNQVIQTRSYDSFAWIPPEDKIKFQQGLERLNLWKLNLVGVDMDQEMLNKAQCNFKNIKAMNNCVRLIQGDSTCLNRDVVRSISKRVSEASHLPKMDSGFSFSSSSPLWLISNPPYGGKGRISSKKSWRELWQKALETYQPQWAVALGPERECRESEIFGQWKCIETQRFLNGGLRVAASLWKKNESTTKVGPS